MRVNSQYVSIYIAPIPSNLYCANGSAWAYLSERYPHRDPDQKGRTIRLPVHVFEKLRRITKAQQQLLSQLGRLPTSAEISAHVSNLAPEQVQEYLEQARLPLSLNLIVRESQTELGQLVKSTAKEEQTEKVLLRRQLREKL